MNGGLTLKKRTPVSHALTLTTEVVNVAQKRPAPKTDASANTTNFCTKPRQKPTLHRLVRT